jgi:hypothetical protein
LSSFNQCSIFIPLPSAMWTVCTLEHANIETTLLVEKLEFEPSVNKKTLPSPRRADRLCDPPSFLCNGCRSSFPGVKRQRHGANHSSPSGVQLQERAELFPCSPYLTSCRGRGQLYRFTFHSLQIHTDKSHRPNPRLPGMRPSVILLRLPKGISRRWSNCHVSWQSASVWRWPRLTGGGQDWPAVRLNGPALVTHRSSRLKRPSNLSCVTLQTVGFEVLVLNK